MTGGTWLDLILVLLLLSYAVTGYRQGLLVSAMSLGGFLAGGALAMWALPRVLQRWTSLQDQSLLRSVVVIVCVFVLAAAGQAAAVALGTQVRGRVRPGPTRVVDSALGSVIVLAATAVLVWFVAGAVRGGAAGPFGRAIGESRVLHVIDAVVPPQTSRLFAGFREVLDREGFPRVFDGLRSEPITEAAPPDPLVADNRAVARAAGSVIKITGISRSCDRAQEGSGWVLAPGKVVTNAHVVAGLSEITVRVTGAGRSYAGLVVVFDPRRDLAVIAVPDLPARSLELGSDLSASDSAVVAGFPLNGPYRIGSARVRDVVQARGADIYGQPGVERQVYSLYARVEPGNSGGPLLDTQGRVSGVVFAKSLDDANTGYALTLDEARPVIEAGRAAASPVSTGPCTVS